MSRPARFSLFQAFACASRGMRLLTRGRNGRIQLGFGAVAIALGVIFRLSPAEWIAVTIAMSLVLSMEAMNTALEKAIDIASPGWNELARDAKDLAAGAVLIASIGSIAVGLIVYLPHFIAFARQWG